MKFYSEICTVQPDPTVVEQARVFSEGVFKTTDYSDSRQFSGEKIKRDHFIGKLGEEAAKIVLSKYAAVSGPDYTIYEGKAKSWAADLIVNGTEVAIKTQAHSDAGKYELSWTFQCDPRSREDRILYQPDAWVIFVELDDITPGYACRVFPPYQIKELQFDKPKLQRLHAYKKVVYAKTLPGYAGYGP